MSLPFRFNVVRQQNMKIKMATALWAIVLALVIPYVSTYIALSVNGRYEPASIGLAGVKSYAWAPYGCYDQDHGWSASMQRLFLPLMFVDARLWHTPDKALSGEYPVTKVDPEEIGEYY